MFVCTECRFSATIDEYCKHVRLWHPKTKYVCGQNNCNKSYTAIQYLKRHLKSEHINKTIVVDENASSFHATGDTSLLIEDQPPVEFELLIGNDYFSNNENPLSIDDIDENYKTFILSLYGDPSLDRKKASSIAATTSKIVLDVLNTIKLKVRTFIEPSKENDFEKEFSNMIPVFKKMNTEKSTMAYLRKQQYYKDPISFTIDETVADTMHSGQLFLGNKKSTAVKLDITFVFKSFFELPGMLEACLNYMQILENETGDEISNVTQGSSWKNRKEYFGSKIVVPFCLYHDDFEPGNTLGANSGVQSLSSFFIHFPSLPPHIATSLENIIPILCCKTKQKTYGFDKILYPTILELRKIEEEGIVMNIDGKFTTVYFALCLLLGDNKALNELVGFTHCFIKTGYCRICFCTAEEAKYMVYEDTSKIRTVNNYTVDLAKNNFKITGIKEECVFNKIPSFHHINCPSVDLMHDVFEGVCHFQLTKTILHMIESNIFTLDDLNNRISLFDFGFYEVGNLPVDIQMPHLKNGRLKMSASESLCFCVNFSLIIGDLVPRNNEVWKLYTTFLQLLDLLLQNSLSQEDILSIKELTKQNHEKYMYLFGTHLKPKQHFMVHYGELVHIIGPLKKLYVMKHEMYHRQLKRYINQTFNRQNLPLSVLIKESLKLACRLVERKGYSQEFFDNEIMKRNEDIYNIKFSTEIKSLMNDVAYSNIQFINSIYFKNILYQPDSIIFNKMADKVDIYKVIYIFKTSSTNIKIFATKLDIIRFDDHFVCYIVQKTNIFKLLDFENLQYFPQCVHKISTGEHAVRIPSKF